MAKTIQAENNQKNIFDAARAGDLKQVKACLTTGIDLTSTNAYGFTALHCAAMASQQVEESKIVEIMNCLIDAGSLLEQTSRDGRTALYLAAEFSTSLAPVQLLIDAGAQTDICKGGVHIVINARIPEVQALLSHLTGYPIPEPEPEIKPVKITAQGWKKAYQRIDTVFKTLQEQGLITLHDAGTTQEDGFADCSQIFLEQGGESARLCGFCFYTRQDLNRAKRTSQLSLAFWGAPEGATEDMERVGRLIVDTFKQAGFAIYWDGSASTRPTLYLRFEE